MLELEETLMLILANLHFSAEGSKFQQKEVTCSGSHHWVDVWAIWTRHPGINLPASGPLLSHKDSGTERKENPPRHQVIWFGDPGYPVLECGNPFPRNEGHPAPGFHCDAT